MPRLTIEKLVHLGQGLAREEGKIWLIPRAAPGDVVDARVVRERRGMVEGEIDAVLEPGPDRIEPACPAYGRCGGCHLQHIAHERQAGLKVGVLREVLQRSGRIEAGPVEAITGEPLGWRYRIELHLRDGHLGFFERRSSALIEVDACPIARPGVSAALPALRAALAGCTRRLPDSEVELVEAGEGRVWIVLRPPQGAKGDPEGLDVLVRVLAPVPCVAGVLSGRGRILAGEAAQASIDWPTIGRGGEDVLLRVGPASFTQANPGLNRALVRAVLARAGDVVGRPVLELYAGSGNLTLPLAAAGAKVTAVEVDGNALRHSERGLKAAGLDARLIAGDTGATLVSMNRQRERFDRIVADPPRDGLGDAAGKLGRFGADRLILCACEPSALARDAVRLVADGFRPEGFAVVDMFPQTYHFETIAVFGR